MNWEDIENMKRFFPETDLEKEQCKCPKCNWSGPLKDTRIDYGICSMPTLLNCPKCDEILINTLIDKGGLKKLKITEQGRIANHIGIVKIEKL